MKCEENGKEWAPEGTISNYFLCSNMKQNHRYSAHQNCHKGWIKTTKTATLTLARDGSDCMGKYLTYQTLFYTR